MTLQSPLHGLVLIALLCSSIAVADQNVLVVLDDSGSMMETLQSDRSLTRMEAAKRALTQVMETLPEDAQVGVLALNSQVGDDSWIVPLGPIDRQFTRQRIAAIRASGGTPLGTALGIAADALLSARSQQIYGTYRLLIVTDGEATDEWLLQENLPKVISRGLVMDVIGVDMRGDHSLATRANSYRRADDAASLQQAIAEVFAETTDASGDAGQSDYEMLSGLPDEAAAAALASLSNVDNRPLAESPRPDDTGAVGQPFSPTTPQTPFSPPASPPATVTPNNSVGLLGSCCNGVVLLFVLAAGIVIASKMQSKNRRR